VSSEKTTIWSTHSRADRTSARSFSELSGLELSFQLSDGSIGIQTDHKTITQGFCFFKITDVTDVEDIKAAVGKDDLFVGPPFPLKHTQKRSPGTLA